MASNTISEIRFTPDRTVCVSTSCNRPAPGIQSPISFGSCGIPKASSITRSPQAFHSEDGDFGLLDIFVDSKDFELHETVRSLRFTAAATNISNLFPLTPRSAITLPPSSMNEIYPSKRGNAMEIVKAIDDRPARTVEKTVVSTVTKMEVQHVSEEDAAPDAGIVKPLTPEAVAKARLELHAFMIEPVTPHLATRNDVSEPESRRPFSLSPRSRKVLEKLSIRRDRKEQLKKAESETPRADDDGGSSSGPQPLSKMVYGLERLFSRISSTSRPAEQNGDNPPAKKPSSASSPTSQKKVKVMLAKWRGDVKKFFGKLLD